MLCLGLKVRLNKLINNLIGDRDDMYKTGKTAFERSNRAKNIDNCPRAYSFATSFKTPRASHGPHVSMKVTEEWGTDPWLSFRKDLLEVADSSVCVCILLYIKSRLVRLPKSLGSKWVQKIYLTKLKSMRTRSTHPGLARTITMLSLLFS